jgi:hypothetical protein
MSLEEHRLHGKCFCFDCGLDGRLGSILQTFGMVQMNEGHHFADTVCQGEGLQPVPSARRQTFQLPLSARRADMEIERRP